MESKNQKIKLRDKWKMGGEIHHNLCLGVKACKVIIACEDNFAYAIISFAFFYIVAGKNNFKSSSFSFFFTHRHTHHFNVAFSQKAVSQLDFKGRRREAEFRCRPTSCSLHRHWNKCQHNFPDNTTVAFLSSMWSWQRQPPSCTVTCTDLDRTTQQREV